MPHPLFIYGTLHPDRAPAAIAGTARLLKPLNGTPTRATIAGHLYNLGDYPGVVLATDSDDSKAIVTGELFTIPNDPAILARLDAYEDFRPNDLTKSLFLRQLATATLKDGTKQPCWVYVYNQPLP